ncbi:ROK family protein [Streptomyces sp. MP131-18]|uniref:ROK family protein n=1 Tax=Streptomyces sp. MP131-18 TaxID=1857892 RepID=UPI00097C4DDF|nr:ROK family protein [Streptomyces sp. MP131-18]ONK10237.1 hypothetical protein STBA_09590 [Streptomyces sp. MP131-18]
MTLPPHLARALAARDAPGPPVHAVEVGGSSVQSSVFAGGTVEFAEGPRPAADTGPFGLAAPGLVIDGRVQGATQLGWDDVEAWRELGYPHRPDVSMNDADAAALGEWLLRAERPGSLLYAGIGTGLGGSLITGGEVVDVRLSHQTGFGEAVCDGCRAPGCLNARIGGQYLPRRLDAADKRRVVDLLATAIGRAGLPGGTVVVLAGGLVRRTHPDLVAALRSRLGGAYPVEGSAAPAAAKSAAYVGLLDRLVGEGRTG